LLRVELAATNLYYVGLCKSVVGLRAESSRGVGHKSGDGPCGVAYSDFLNNLDLAHACDRLRTPFPARWSRA